MQKRSPWHALKLVLLAVALITTAMALYVHVSERTSQEQIFVEPPAELETGIPEELQKAEPPAQESDGPRPGAVLRRSESARDRALQQALSPESSTAAAIARLEQRVEAMDRQADQAGRVVHRDLEEIRAAVRRERSATGKIIGLLLAALASLGLHAAIGFVEERAAKQDPAGHSAAPL